MKDDEAAALGLQMHYTYSELAKKTGISRRRIERLCRNEGLKTDRVGNRHIVWISEIEKHLPMMFASMVTLARTRLLEIVWRESAMEEQKAKGKAKATEFKRNGRHIRKFGDV